MKYWNLECLRSSYYRDYLLKGVSKYKIEIEKYRPINEVNKIEDQQYQKALKIFAKKKEKKLMNNFTEQPFKFKDLKPKKK